MNIHQIIHIITLKGHPRIILNQQLDFYKPHKVCLKIDQFFVFLVLLIHKIKNKCKNKTFLIVLHLRLVNLKISKISL